MLKLSVSVYLCVSVCMYVYLSVGITTALCQKLLLHLFHFLKSSRGGDYYANYYIMQISQNNKEMIFFKILRKKLKKEEKTKKK